LIAADQPSDEASKKDLARLQGDWAAVSHVRDGQKLPDDDAQSLFRTVKGNEYTVSRFKQVVGRGTFKVDATKTPKTVDFQPVAAAGQSAAPLKPMLGIYEFDGENWKVCIAPPGRDRPTTFESKPGSGLTATVWEREMK
jgi:uncharacterized protein (TIGR03067 family)